MSVTRRSIGIKLCYSTFKVEMFVNISIHQLAYSVLLGSDFAMFHSSSNGAVTAQDITYIF